MVSLQNLALIGVRGCLKLGFCGIKPSLRLNYVTYKEQLKSINFKTKFAIALCLTKVGEGNSLLIVLLCFKPTRYDEHQFRQKTVIFLF